MFKKLLIATVGMVGMGYCMVSGDKITQCQMREWDRYAGEGYSRDEIKALLSYITEQCVEEN